MAHDHDEQADETPQSSENQNPHAQPMSGNNESLAGRVDKADSSQTEGVPQDLGAQILSAATEAKVESLVELVRSSEKNYWAIGDYTLDLTENDSVTLAALEKRTGWKMSRLSIYRATAKAFPHEVRDYSRPFYDYEKTRAAVDRIADEARRNAEQSPGAVADALQKFVQPNYVEMMDYIAAEEAKSTTTVIQKGKKKGQTKTVTKKLDKRATTELLAKAARKAIRQATAAAHPHQPHPHLDRVYHSTNEALLQRWLDEGVELKFRLIGLDPPYGDYDKHSDGHLDQGTSAASFTGADNAGGEEALDTTCRTIRLLPHFLAVGGVILLWQGCRYLRPEIAIAIRESGLEVDICLVWVKKVPQPGHFVTAWTRQCEFCYVIRRKEEKALNHDGSSRANVFRHELDGPEVPSNILEHWFDGPAVLLDGCHWWRKPMKMMEDLVRKCTNEGDNVLDLFACTGSLSIAATKLNRRFVYVESHPENFEENSCKVLGALEAAQKTQASTGTVNNSGAIEPSSPCRFAIERT